MRDISTESNSRGIYGFSHQNLSGWNQEFWRAHVPARLVDLFGELWTAIAEQEGVRMTETVTFTFGEPFPRHVIIRESSGKQEVRFGSAIDDLVALWRKGKLEQIPIQSAALEYSDRKKEGFDETVSSVHFEVNEDNKVSWSVGKGEKFPLFWETGGVRGWLESQGECGTSNAEIAGLVERMIPLLEGRHYRYTIDHRPRSKADDRGISPI